MTTRSSETKELAPLDINELHLVERGDIDVSQLIWNNEIALGFMNDHHIKNAVLALLGFSDTTIYDSTDEELRWRWVKAFRLEWKKRVEGRKAVFDRR